MRKAKFFPMYLLLLVSLVSCSVREEVPFETGMGGIRLELLTDLTATRADAEGQLSPEDFKIEIINPQGVIFKRWDTYAEYLAQESTVFAMNAGGPYTLRASYGDSAASGFNAFFFIGEQEFTVQPQQVTDVSVTCRMGNVKVAVEFGDNIRKQYTEYTATVSTLRGSLVFDKDCKEAGYLPCGDISVYVELTGPDGETSGFTNSKEIVGEPGDFITLKIDTGEVPDSEVSLTVSIDPATNDHQVNIELPSDMLPDKAGADISAIPAGDVWATRVYVDMTTDGDPAELYPEVRAYGASEWSRPSFTSSVSGSVNSVTLTGLEPATRYEIRARYKSAVSSVQEFTTETAQQVENAGFEEWSEWTYYVNKTGLFWGDDVYQTNYAPYLNEESRWWDCNNSETTPGNRTNTGASYKSFPMVSYVEGHESNRAAQMMTIAVSNSATSGTAPFPTVGFGRIFTGVYGGEQGRPFASRPTRMSFWYKYSPYDSDSFKAYISVKSGETVIGEGTLTSSSSVSSWTQVYVDINYTVTDLKADTIYVEFVCGSGKDKWQYGMDIIYGGGLSANVHGGSILAVDDIELMYE